MRVGNGVLMAASDKTQKQKEAFLMNSQKRTPRKILTLCALAALLCVLATSALAADYAVVKGGYLNLRQTASLDAKVLGQYATGTWVEIISEENGWAKVNVNGKSGYMMSKYLTDGTTTNVKYVHTNTGIGLNLRTSPSMNGTIITSYPINTKVNVIVAGAQWSKVSVNGNEGYMSSRFLKSASAPSYTKPVTPFTATLKNINGGSVVNFRLYPGMNTKIIKQVAVGTQVTVKEMGENWSLVEINGQEGYVSTYFLKY